jgi:uncharacterized protein
VTCVELEGVKSFWLSMMLLWVTTSALAVAFPQKPPKEHFYVDEAGLLNTADAEAIDATALTLLREEQIPILVVTIPSLISYQAGQMSIEQYAQALFDEWGIGRQERNYGILLLVSVGDRRARIELGAAWAGAHDEDAEYVMSDLMVPAFKSGDFSGGIRQGVEALDKMARGLGLPKPKIPWWVPVALLAGIAAMIGVIVSLFKSGRSGWGWALIVGLGILLLFLLRAAAKNSGSGGSFGGGSSGGGGASGSW